MMTFGTNKNHLARKKNPTKRKNWIFTFPPKFMVYEVITMIDTRL